MMRRKAVVGFTLLELVVALAVASLVALMGTGALSTVLGFFHRGSDNNASREQVRAAQRIVAHEWRARGGAVRSDGSSLEFLTAYPVARRWPTEQVVAQVRYACERADDGLLRLTHSVRTLAPQDGGKTYDQTQVLAQDMRLCAFDLLQAAHTGTREPEPRPRWVQRWSVDSPPPNLMRLALSGLHEDMPAQVHRTRAAELQP